MPALPVVAQVEDLEAPQRAHLLWQLLELVAAQVEHLDRVGRVREGAAAAQRRQLVALREEKLFYDQTPAL